MRSHGPALAVLIACAFAGPASPAETACRLKLEDRLRTDLSLPEFEFDQSEAKGWRVLANAGCEPEAESLMRAYIAMRGSAGRTLKWHLAQSIALQGRTDEAAALGYSALQTGREQSDKVLHWNTYVLGTIGHWRRDRVALDESLEKLRGTRLGSNPNDQFRKALEWLARCFNEPYSTSTCK